MLYSMAYPISKRIIIPIYKLWLKKPEGTEKIPQEEPFIIAANHSSYFDVFLPPTIVVPKVNKKIHPIVNSYYWKNFLTGFFLKMWEAIPVYVYKEKDSKKKNREGTEKAISFLKSKELVMIFPEGTRNDGTLKKAYTGVARLALGAKVPVLPFGIIGANEVLPKGKAFPKFKKCEVKIGKPMYFDKYYGKKINDKMLEEITRSIMKEIAKLINQKYNY